MARLVRDGHPDEEDEVMFLSKGILGQGEED
jgi:hypothetical protein